MIFFPTFVNLEKHSHMANDFQSLKVTRIKRLSLINLLDLHKTVWYIFPLILRRMVSTFEYLSQQHGFESNYLHNLFYTFTPWPHRYQSQRGHKDLIAPTKQLRTIIIRPINSHNKPTIKSLNIGQLMNYNGLVIKGKKLLAKETVANKSCPHWRP